MGGKAQAAMHSKLYTCQASMSVSSLEVSYVKAYAVNSLLPEI